MDGWCPRDLKYLPSEAWDYVAGMYNRGESGEQQWPEQVLQSHTTGIPKPGEAGIRPITVSVALYRLYGRVRSPKLLLWLESLLEPREFRGMYGFRLGRGTRDMSSLLMALVESMLDMGMKPMVFGIDFRRCYDYVPWKLLWHVCKCSGLDEGVLRALETAYNGMKRRWRVGKVVGPVFRAIVRCL